MALRLDMPVTLSPEMRQLAMRIGLGALVVLLTAYVLVGMPLLEGRKLDASITETKLQLDGQQKLLPTIASISAGASNATLTAMEAPKPVPVPRAQAYLMTDQLKNMATAVGLETLDVTLNTAGMAQDPDTIQAQGMFSGQNDGVRAFLIELARLPSLARVERVEIRAVDGHLEMMVLLRIALGG
ncbi:MAG: hypothetical protein P4L39_07040 [Humidesulfovibrio sp.]|nr:hypothetical protein [Humidesulfovibrio sp.]